MKTVTLDVRPAAESEADVARALDRAEEGGIVFPFDAVKVEFLLRAA